MDEFLTFGQMAADPWRRVGCMRKPMLLVIEFCQVQGPRPLYCHPKDGGENNHWLEDIAVWLMSSENMHANFCALYNQQLDVHVLVQYATMLDITARAFQRPFAISLLMPNKPVAQDIVLFQKTAISLLVPLLSCNRRYVHSILRQIMLLTTNSEHKNVQSYYSTSGNAQQLIVVSNKIKSIVQQTRAWYDRMSEQLYSTENSGTLDECLCECGHEEFRRFITLLSQKQPGELINLMSLCPCKGIKLKQLVEEAYQRLTRTEGAKGLMFCGNTAVLRSTFGANSELQTVEDPDEEQVEENIPNIIAAKEDTLKSLSYRLLRCVYPLLIGERILILASKQRRYTGTDLLNKLNSLRICRRPEGVQWNFECKDPTFSDRNQQLIGVSCENDQAVQWVENPPCQDADVIDLNNHKMRTRNYFGRLLWQLTGRRNFPSDASVIAFVASVVTDMHQLLLLSRYISPESVITQMALTPSDQLILYHCLVEFNVTRYTHLDNKKREMLTSIPYKKMKF